MVFTLFFKKGQRKKREKKKKYTHNSSAIYKIKFWILKVSITGEMSIHRMAE